MSAEKNFCHPEDFLIDNTFQSYCAGTNELCISYWEKFVLQNPQHTAAFEEARRIYYILNGNKKPLNQQVQAAKHRLSANTFHKPIRIFRNSWVRIAAALVLLAGLAIGWYMLTQSNPAEPAPVVATTHKTIAGERKKLVLPDGSVVILNTKSQIKVHNNFNKNARDITLEGEAYFEVAHNAEKPFRVFTRDFKINVLGTTFDVKAYPDEATSEATLIKGLINMEDVSGTKGAITLKPSQKVIFNHAPVVSDSVHTPTREVLQKKAPQIIMNTYTLINENVIMETAWTQNRMEIREQRFGEIKNLFEKWYDVKITFLQSDIENYNFTATFTNETVEQALKALQEVEHFTYTINGKNISISR